MKNIVQFEKESTKLFEGITMPQHTAAEKAKAAKKRAAARAKKVKEDETLAGMPTPFPKKRRRT